MGRRLHQRVSLFIQAGALVVLLSAIAPATAHADLWCFLFGGDCKGGSSRRATADRTNADRATPEIDVGTLVGAFALAGGGAAMLGDRFRRRR